MRILRAVLAAALTGALAVALFGGASAGTASAASAACSKIMVTDADLGGLGGKKFVASEFSTAAKAFKTGARSAPPKVKRAMLTMANYYKKISKADSANDAVSSLRARDTEKYTNASLVWDTYIATNCS